MLFLDTIFPESVAVVFLCVCLYCLWCVNDKQCPLVKRPSIKETFDANFYSFSSCNCTQIHCQTKMFVCIYRLQRFLHVNTRGLCLNLFSSFQAQTTHHHSVYFRDNNLLYQCATLYSHFVLPTTVGIIMCAVPLLLLNDRCCCSDGRNLSRTPTGMITHYVSSIVQLPWNTI